MAVRYKSESQKNDRIYLRSGSKLLPNLQQLHYIHNWTMSFFIKPLSADLTHDVDWLTRMDPYVKLYYGGECYCSKTCSNGAKHPTWKDSFEIKTNVENRLLRVEVWDRQLTGDVEVGVGQINLEKILKTGGGEQFIELFYNHGISGGRLTIGIDSVGFKQGTGMCSSNPSNVPISKGVTYPQTGQNPQIGQNPQPMMGGYEQKNKP